MPLAYFITFTTYGTRLHGSGKGSVDLEHNAFDTPLLPPDPEREVEDRGRMTQAPYIMSGPEREIVCRAIVELSHEKEWDLLAAHVRTNHVHVVIAAARDLGRLMSDLKGLASRDLTRAGFDDISRRRWTRHGSTRHLLQADQVEEKIRYTLDEQGDRMSCYAKTPRTM